MENLKAVLAVAKHRRSQQDLQDLIAACETALDASAAECDACVAGELSTARADLSAAQPDLTRASEVPAPEAPAEE